jgi:2-polyprenyl-3-methyl-5-hydroxy-6-metoxy-1,4-benzoquinol methylase
MNLRFDRPLDHLQRDFAAAALKLSGAPFDPAGGEAFRESVRRTWGYYRSLAAKATPRGLAGAELRIDRVLHRRYREEYIDDPALPAALRAALVSQLNSLNHVLLSYPQFFAALEAFAAHLPGTSLAVLDIGSGHGAFPIAMAKKGKLAGKQLDVTGSDISPLYVEAAQAAAIREKARVDFHVVDALRLNEMQARYDIITSSQTIHHFSPEFVAELFARLKGNARYGVVLFDAQRTLPTLVGAAIGTALVGRNRYLVHDGVISVRRMYAPAELELLARCAPGGEIWRSSNWGPAYTVTEARF